MIISLCWIHCPILQSGCGCFFYFCTFSLLESTQRMVLKASFQTLQGHFFCLNLLPLSHPIPGTKHSLTNQLILAGGMKSAGAVPTFSLRSIPPGRANPSLHTERASRPLSEKKLCTHSEWLLGTVTTETLPTFISPRLWQTELNTFPFTTFSFYLILEALILGAPVVQSVSTQCL